MSYQNFIINSNEDGIANYLINIPLTNWNNRNKNDKYKVEAIVKNKKTPVEQSDENFIVRRSDTVGINEITLNLYKNEKLIQTQVLKIKIVSNQKNQITNQTESSDKIKPIIEISGDVKETVEKIIEEMDLKIVFGAYTHYPEYGNTEKIYRELKKLKDDDTVGNILINNINSSEVDILYKWKCLVILKLFKNIEAINIIDKVITLKDDKKKSETKYIHEECVKLLIAVNTFKNRGQVIDKLLYIINESSTNTAKKLAIDTLVTSGKRDDNNIIEQIIEIVDIEPDLQTRKSAMNGLLKYNLSGYVDNIINWLQDSNVEIRRSAVNLAQKYSKEFDFDTIIEIFEMETDMSCQQLLGKLLLQVDEQNAIEFLNSILDSGDETIMNNIMQLFINHGKKIDSVLEKSKEMKNSGNYSTDFIKQVDLYITKFDNK